jgi:LCP family protein required for cell wall assembly
MGKHSKQGISYWETRSRRRDLRNRAKVKNKPPRKHRPIAIYWFVAFFLVGIMGGTALGYYAKPIAKFGAQMYLSLKQGQWQPKGTEKKQVAKSLTILSSDPNQSVNTLVIGSDQGSNRGEGGWCRSDVMMLVCLQERDKKAVVVSIPRDTKVEIAGHGTEKINAAHSFGGPSGAIDAVKALTGLDVHHYISMNFEGFKQIINAIGGVPVHLSSAINDPHSGYLPAGDLLLDGEQALVVVRSRKLPNGDIDRIKSQQAFLKALMRKAETMKSVWKGKRLVDIMAATCQMDYNAVQLTSLAEELRGFQLDNVQFVTVPGDAKTINGASYFIPNMPLLAEIATDVKQDTWMSPELISKLASPESTRVEELNSPDSDVVTVVAGTRSLLGAVPVVAKELRLLGHEKVFEGLANQVHMKSLIIYRPEAKQRFEAIRGSIPELDSAGIVEDATVPSQYNSPVVIVLGSDFATPSMTAVYGRMLKPAVNVDSFGKRVKSFS